MNVGYLQITVFPASDSKSSELLFFAQYPLKPNDFYAVSLAMKEDEGNLVVNGDTVTFVFPILNSNPNVNNGEAPSGPTYFQAHTAPITVGCELARSSQRFGGPGGTETASFSCRPNASVQALNISFSAPPGNALRAIQVTCSDGTASGWLGNTTELANETQAALTGIDKVTSLTVQYGLLVNRLGLGNLSSEVVGAEPPAPNTLQSGRLNCRGAPVIGLMIAFGNNVDSIALLCARGTYFKGALLNALRWRDYLNTSQLAPVVQELGGVVWNFEARGQLGRWVGRTNSTQSDLLNSSSLFTPDELRLPQQGIALLQSPRFYFLNLSVPVLPPNALGIRWRTSGTFQGTLPPALPRTPPRRTSRRAAPHPTLGSFTDIRLDDAALLALLKNYSTAPLTLDFIATGAPANSNFLEFINYWDDSNWTACQAACGEGTRSWGVF
eukprot:g48962.t1